MKILRFRSEARRDLREIAAYLRRESGSAALGRRFLVAAENSLSFISEFPLTGMLVESGNPKWLGLRAVMVRGFEKYMIFYLPGDRYIRVIRVLHGARDLQSVLDED